MSRTRTRSRAFAVAFLLGCLTGLSAHPSSAALCSGKCDFDEFGDATCTLSAFISHRCVVVSEGCAEFACASAQAALSPSGLLGDRAATCSSTSAPHSPPSQACRAGAAGAKDRATPCPPVRQSLALDL